MAYVGNTVSDCGHHCRAGGAPSGKKGGAGHLPLWLRRPGRSPCGNRGQGQAPHYQVVVMIETIILVLVVALTVGILWLARRLGIVMRPEADGLEALPKELHEAELRRQADKK